MPSAVIVDAFGNPAQFSGSGNLYRRTADDERLRPSPPQLYGDYVQLLSPATQKRLISESRQIASRGQVNAAIWQKAGYVSASHWQPYFDGDDGDWGEQAEQLLDDTKNNVCTRGERFPWRRIWKMSIPTRASDGGFFVLLTTGDNNWPLLQMIEAHRIGQRGSALLVGPKDATSTFTAADGTTKQVQGLYEGLKIFNGIIYNATGNEVAYRVLGATAADDEDISARDMIHVAAPRWYSEGRPLPEIAPALLDFYGIDMGRTSALDQQIIDAKLTFAETNETGVQDPITAALNPPRAGQTPNGTNPELVERATWRYLKSGSGKLETVKSNRPSNEWMNLDERMSGIAIAAMGWRLEMLDPSGLRGAATRGFQDQINTCIMDSFGDAEPAVVRCVRYLVSKHIQNGMLPDNPEFLKWKIAPPAEFSVDRNQLKTDLDGVRTGAESMPMLQRRLGHRARKVLRSQGNYEVLKDQIAAELGIAPQRLGSLTIPGDKAGYTTGQDPEADPNNPNPPTTVAQP